MKKMYLFLTLGIMMSFYAMAQDSDLKPFKIDVSGGYAIPGGSGSKGGVIFVVEPKYAVASSLCVGLRIETAVVARFSGYDMYGDPQDISVKASESYLVTGDYYFTDNYSLRPFAGAGAGLFTLASVSSNSSADGIATNARFGGMVRAGIELRHFRIGFEYNIVPSTTFSGFDNNGDPATLTSKNGYIGIKLGACIGGGPRR